MPSEPPARVTSMIELSTVAGRSTLASLPVAVGLEADAVDRAIDFRHADDLLDLLGQRGILLQIDDFAAETLGLLEAVGDHVADDHDRRAQQMARRGARQADRPRAGDIDRSIPGPTPAVTAP